MGMHGQASTATPPGPAAGSQGSEEAGGQFKISRPGEDRGYSPTLSLGSQTQPSQISQSSARSQSPERPPRSFNQRFIAAIPAAGSQNESVTRTEFRALFTKSYRERETRTAKQVADDVRAAREQYEASVRPPPPPPGVTDRTYRRCSHSRATERVR